MRKRYDPPRVTEVRLDHMVNLTGGCKKTNEKASTGGKRCNSDTCKLSGATS